MSLKDNLKTLVGEGLLGLRRRKLRTEGTVTGRINLSGLVDKAIDDADLEKAIDYADLEKMVYKAVFGEDYELRARLRARVQLEPDAMSLPVTIKAWPYDPAQLFGWQCVCMYSGTNVEQLEASEVCVPGDLYAILTRYGFSIEVTYQRWYRPLDESDLVLLTADEARFLFPIAVRGIFRKIGGGVEVRELGEYEPLQARGGETTVTLVAPSGHFAVAESRCDDHDTFNKQIGRTMALLRAIEKFNKVVNNEQ